MTARGKMSDHIAIRLAGEGVPIAAISRALIREKTELRRLLKEAQRGKLIEVMPPEDWPKESRFAQRYPSAPVIDLAGLEPIAEALQAFYGFTRAEARFVALLVEHGQALDPTIIGVISMGGESTAIVKVTACRVRKKLRLRFGVTLVTAWGRGYALPDPSRQKIREIVGTTRNGVLRVAA